MKDLNLGSNFHCLSLESSMSRIQNPQGGIQNTDCQILLHGVNFNITVKPVNNGSVLSSHPLLSDQFSKSQFFTHTNPVLIFVTSIKRPPSNGN